MSVSKKNQPVTMDIMMDKIKRFILTHIEAVEHNNIGKDHQAFRVGNFVLEHQKTHPGVGADYYYCLNGRHIAWMTGAELWGFIEDELLERSGNDAADKNTLVWLQDVYDQIQPKPIFKG